MSWQDHRRRREVLIAVLDRARRDPAGPVPFETVPHAAEVFADRAEVLRALHHRWLMLLSARLELAVGDEGATGDGGDGGDDRRHGGAGSDRASAVAAAWRRLAADEPVLRAVLDAHPPGHRAAREEHRMLALWAGLAEPHEPADEVATIGARYAALLRAPARAKRPCVKKYLRWRRASVAT